MSIFVIAQLVGFAALLISICIFQVNKRALMLRLGMFAGILYSIHFFLLGAYTGSAMNLVGASRSYIFYKVKPDKKHVWILYVFTAIVLVAGLLTWQGPLSLLPMTASIIGGIAIWHRKPKSIRRWALMMPPLWFTYNLLVGSYPGMIVEVLMFSSNLIGEYRFDIHHKKHMRRKLAKPT